ncbi:rhodanese-like domain-containing protein [Natribacillus halophilus]|uniref:Rhodanese-related sulfurtransferase n=1 Tax=Natribacillus halophilus TaxID=549003 RepID=A0A1G8JM00_9BACI|nr:rhodanese-like domain-containing protein [Natribacillus halophilus]SDI32091.1 Rhodanese-related sulfurtransferase [Natribacillus halophilus]
MDFLQILSILLWGGLIGFALVMLIRRLRTPSYLVPLTQEEFIKGYRKAQLIDVREPKEYNGGHIWGARNIPLSQLKQRLIEVRKDQQVYLYDNSGSRSRQAARILKKKNGNDNLHYLKSGFKKWTGKVKKKKK